MSQRIRAAVAAALFLVTAAFASAASAELVTRELAEALEAVATNGASDYQRALLFANNDVVNAAALSGEIPDNLYQAAQSDFAATNRRLAADSASAAGADFTVQQPSSSRYSPGTDSDYITVVESKEQIADMQRGYNDRVNQYLAEAGLDAPPRDNWHNTLDTDFMADPRHVSAEEFREIADLNNDAYKRRHAAEYERLSRSGGRVGPDDIRDYGLEMQDFAAKKQKAVAEMLENPEAFADPLKRAELHRLLAQEQKYISRIEAAVDTLRAQEGLPPLDRSSLAGAGSRRAADNFLTTAQAGSVGRNTLTNAVDDLVSTLGEVAKTNPEFAAGAAEDIAQLMSRLPAADQGRIIEALRAQHSDDFAQQVAAAARQRNAAVSSLDELAEAARAGADIVDTVDDLSLARRAANAGLAALDALGRAANALEVADAARQMRDYFNVWRTAMDPSTSDADAEAMFARMSAIAEGLAGSAALSALLEASPALGAAYGTWIISYEGTGWVLRNTQTGQAISRVAVDVFDRGMQASEDIEDYLTEYFGGESERMRLSSLEWDILERYIRGVREGRIRLRDGFTMRDILDSILRGEPASAREAMVDRDIDGRIADTGDEGVAGACDASDWAGAWSTNWGAMRLSGGAGGVSGNYDYDDGHISGTLDETGCILTGSWDEAPSRDYPSDKGNIVFTLSADGTSFTGAWGYGPEGAGSGGWDGKKE